MNVLQSVDVAGLSRQVDLCCAILRCPADEARALLRGADGLGVDPLDCCARRLGLGEDVVMRRAAHWAGLDFEPNVPHTIRGSAALLRLDALAEAHVIHALGDDGERFYLSPSFDEIVGLRRRLQRGPSPHRLVATTRTALRRALADANAPALLTEARQRLTRHWPHASASVDLSLGLRLGFVAILLAIVIFTALAPLLARPLLLPFLLVLIVAPALLRLLATFSPSAAHRRSRAHRCGAPPLHRIGALARRGRHGAATRRSARRVRLSSREARRHVSRRGNQS